MTTKQARSAPPLTYVVKSLQPVQKYVGYKRETQYSANEEVGVCDCVGFSYRNECKHLLFKSLLSQFRVTEFIFFGDSIGECKPKSREEIMSIGDELKEPLKKHFFYDVLEVKSLIQNPTNPDLYNCVQFEGERKQNNVLVMGYHKGVMFLVYPKEKKEEKQDVETSKIDF